MRYSYCALVLATAAIAHVAAGPVHGHAHFHAKKDAAPLQVEENVEKRQGWEDIDWATVKITYSAGQTWGDATPAPAAPAPVATAAPEVAAAPASAPATTTPAPAAPAAPAAAGSEAAAVLSASDLAKLTSMGCMIGVNAVTNNGGVWMGDDGDYVHEVVNSSGEDLILVIWGALASWVNVAAPHISISLPAGEKATVSFASGSVGAMTAVYSDTEMVNGQLAETWVEYTHSVEGVVDISREVKMSGHAVEVVGPSCTCNLNQCVFICSEGESCLTGYELINCEAGSQPGAQYGLFEGAPSGGCGGMGSSGKFTTTFS